jgi:hypothetical protein
VLETRHGASRAPVHLGIAICVATAAVHCWLMSRLVVVMVMVVVDDDDDWGPNDGVTVIWVPASSPNA